jgi:hypothetical protein
VVGAAPRPLCAGLAVFLTVANPAAGRNNVGADVWVLMLSSDAVLALGLLMVSRGRPARQRAMLYSASAGVIYGAAAALTKTSSHLLDRGLWRVVDHWQPYLLIVVAVGGMVIAQSAFQAGVLDVSLPTMSVVDPIVSILIGAFAFREAISSSAAAVTLEGLSLFVMTVGIVLLSRSEAVRMVHEPSKPPP